MLWLLEIGTVLQTPEGRTWGPFSRNTVTRDDLAKYIRQEFTRLGAYLATVAEVNPELERLVYVKTRVLSSPSRSRSE